MLSGPKGRRDVRRQLREAGFHTRSDDAPVVLNRHHGEMCFSEGLRSRALQKIWPIMRMLASGELPLDHFNKLMTETDSE